MGHGDMLQRQRVVNAWGLFILFIAVAAGIVGARTPQIRVYSIDTG